MEKENPEIQVQAGVSVFDGKPFCIVRWGEMAGQLTPSELAMHGLRAIEASIEAERDAGLVAYLQSVGFSQEEAALMLQGVRNHREQREKPEAGGGEDEASKGTDE